MLIALRLLEAPRAIRSHACVRRAGPTFPVPRGVSTSKTQSHHFHHFAKLLATERKACSSVFAGGCCPIVVT
jgi:hypothetical protein